MFNCISKEHLCSIQSINYTAYIQNWDFELLPSTNETKTTYMQKNGVYFQSNIDVVFFLKA